MAKPTTSLPLAGIRLVEFAGIGPGPFAAMLLGDMGAEILRIDRPGGADPWTKRIIRRGRRTVDANLKSPEDVAAVRRLIAASDGIIEGYRPGVLERLGLGPDVLLADNPRLVIGRMTGWGQDGPLAQSAGHDITYIAITGALAAIGPAERPVPPLNIVGDMGGGALYLAMGMLAAILGARATGQGRVVDCAIADCTVNLMAMFSDLADQGRWTMAREANLLDGGAPFYRTYPCADGKFLAVGALEPHFFSDFCARIGLDPAPTEAERMDRANWPALIERIGARIVTKSRDDWAALLEGTDACAAPVLTLDEAPNHPHLAARRAFTYGDGFTQPNIAPRFSETVAEPAGLQEPYPSLTEALRAWSI